ncbi:MAG: glycosyltransferase family 9 protein [Sphingobacteriia bacterium]|nr:glycosyltransferase family 9 protein [Sphingobacteriia bacterium]
MLNKTNFVSKKNYYFILIVHNFIKPFFYLSKLFRLQNKLLPNKILFIELGHLGDMLTSINAIEIAKKKLPQHKVICICTASGAAALENNPNINEVVIIDTPHWYENDKRKNTGELIRSFFKFIKVVKKTHATIAVNFRNTSYHLDHIAIWCSGIVKSIGFGHKGLDYLLSYAYIPKKEEVVIPLQKIAFINSWFQIPVSDKFENRPSFFPDSFQQNASNLLLQSKGINLNERFITVNVAAQHNFWWPHKSFIELCNLIHKGYPNFKVLFIGQKQHIEPVKHIMKQLGFTSYSVVGETDLSMLYFILKKAALLVTIDTGVRHIANAAGIPVIVLRHGADGHKAFGKYIASEELLVHAVSCSPCGQKKCPLGTVDCMSGITVDAVFNQLKNILDYTS